MFRFPILPATILPAAMAAMIAVGATGAVHASTGESESRREIATVLGAKTSLVQAIDAAERHSGGRAMKIDVEEKNGAFLYEVKTASKDRITEIRVDPASGTVVGTDDEGPIARIFDREDQDELARLARPHCPRQVDRSHGDLGGPQFVAAELEAEDAAGRLPPRR